MEPPWPSLEGATEWLAGSAEEALREAEGRPILIHFWSVSCGMCKDNLPRVAEWREKYRDRLRVIAIHMPRYPEDANIDAVREAAGKYGIIEPLAIDNEHKLRERLSKTSMANVPAYYLFDEQHKLKSFAAGEYGVKVMEPALERLLGVANTAAVG